MTQKTGKYFTILFGMILMSTIYLPPVAADGGLTLKINKNMGTAYSDKIEGTFTFTGAGPETIVNLTLTFNETEVAFEPGHELVHKFETENYPLGYMNITLWGADSEGNLYSVSEMYGFISSDIGLYIGLGVLAIIVISGVFAIAMNRKKKGPPPTIDQIKIEKL